MATEEMIQSEPNQTTFPPNFDWIANTDGGCRGNPGPAAWAYVLKQKRGDEFVPHSSDAGFLECASNNAAEYRALIELLKRARNVGAKSLFIRSDSELMVKQINGEYIVQSPELEKYWEEAVGLQSLIPDFRLVHIKRVFNTEPDELCNDVLAAAGYPCKRKKK